MNREQALQLLRQYNDSESLVHHGMAVEAVMRHYARKLGEDEEYWGQVGLLHDIDYGKYPQEHCKKAPELLSAAGYDEAFIHAVVSHGYGLCCDVEPELLMEKVLFAVDELTGLVTACVYMRPSKSVLDLEFKSLKKKYKSKGFTAGVDRSVIERGVEALGWQLEDVMADVIAGMQENAEEIGLKGEL